MTNFKSILFAVLAFGVTAVASAVEWSINAAGSAVPNEASADVSITAKGSGSFNRLAQTHTSVSSLTQKSGYASTLRILNGELFSVNLLSIQTGKAALTIGNAVGVGTVESLAGSLTLNNASANALTLNADVMVPTNVICKTGTGTVAVRGAMVGDLDQQAGAMTYYAADGSTASLTVTGEGPAYGPATRYADRSQLKETAPTAGGVKSVESVLTTAGGAFPLNELKVGGGSVVRLNACDFRQLEMTEDDSYWYDSVPECLLVGSESVGILKLEGGSLHGKLAIATTGAVEQAKGVVFVDRAAEVRNYCASGAEGEPLFGRSGYAYLEVAGGSTNVMYGHWASGTDGQTRLVITNALFSHAPSSVRPSGFTLQGAGSSLYVGKDGRFEATDVACGATVSDSASVTVADGGVFDMGSSVLQLKTRAVLNVNAGGTLRASGVKSVGAGAYLQFDGGAWQLSGGAASASQVLVQKGGVTIDVPSGEASLTGDDAFRYPSGSVLESIAGGDDAVFLGPPAVIISSTVGRGASADCVWDRASGRVTGIRVTGAGVGYTAVSAKLRYGSGETPLEVTTAEAQAGGVVKTGSGTLVLSGRTNLLNQAVVREGTLKIGVADALHPDSSIQIEDGACLDLGGLGTNDVRAAGYYNAGNGVIENGVLTLTGLVCDFDRQTNRVCYLDMDRICFTEMATIRIPNVRPDLDRRQGYELYRFKGEASAGDFIFPRLDDSTTAVLSKAWGVVVENRVNEFGVTYKAAVLRYVGGSLFIYY